MRLLWRMHMLRERLRDGLPDRSRRRAKGCENSKRRARCYERPRRRAIERLQEARCKELREAPREGLRPGRVKWLGCSS